MKDINFSVPTAIRDEKGMAGSARTRPILFSGPMVRAILDGRKSQTRRVMKPQPEYHEGTIGAEYFGWRHCGDGGKVYINTTPPACPYGQPGELLWIRETFAKRYADAERDPSDGIMYRADGGCIIEPRWTPGIHMPRWASRLTLRITDVRVQRVQEITPEDAISEGTRCWVCNGRVDGSSEEDCTCFHTKGAAVPSFEVLWDSINAKRGYSWESNPWVWAISFERVV